MSAGPSLGHVYDVVTSNVVHETPTCRQNGFINLVPRSFDIRKYLGSLFIIASNIFLTFFVYYLMSYLYYNSP